MKKRYCVKLALFSAFIGFAGIIDAIICVFTVGRFNPGFGERLSRWCMKKLI